MAEASSITLHTGVKMPSIGLGTWKISKSAAAGVVYDAIKSGYRSIDCACDYGNEAEVGAGIARAIAEGLVTRADLFVTSKLWCTYHAPEHVPLAAARSLSDLGVGYFDLYLIHFPIPLAFVPFETRYPPEWMADAAGGRAHMEFSRVPLSATWRAMEALVAGGVARAIGVCNFTSGLLSDLISGAASVRPAVLQVEAHPFLVQAKLLRHAAALGVAVTAFSPLGAGSYVQLGMATEADSVLRSPVVAAIAARVGGGVSPAQVVLAWGMQRGTAVIPKASSPEHLAENLAAARVRLTEEDMAAIAGLDRRQRYNDPGVFCELAFKTFVSIFD